MSRGQDFSKYTEYTNYSDWLAALQATTTNPVTPIYRADRQQTVNDNFGNLVGTFDGNGNIGRVYLIDTGVTYHVGTNLY